MWVLPVFPWLNLFRLATEIKCMACQGCTELVLMKMGRWRQNLRKDSFLPSNNCKTFGNISSNTDSMDSRLSYKSQRPWHFLTSTFYRQGFVDVGGVYVGISSCLSGLIAELDWAYSASRRSGSWRKNASIEKMVETSLECVEVFQSQTWIFDFRESRRSGFWLR